MRLLESQKCSRLARYLIASLLRGANSGKMFRVLHVAFTFRVHMCASYYASIKKKSKWLFRFFSRRYTYIAKDINNRSPSKWLLNVLHHQEIIICSCTQAVERLLPVIALDWDTAYILMLFSFFVPRERRFRVICYWNAIEVNCLH